MMEEKRLLKKIEEEMQFFIDTAKNLDFVDNRQIESMARNQARKMFE